MRRKRNELTKSIDGVDRMSIRVGGRLTLSQIADQLTTYGYMMHDFATYSAEHGYTPDPKIIRAVLSSRQAVIKTLQDCIWHDGVERAGYVIGAEGLEDTREEVLAHLRTLWPGETI